MSIVACRCGSRFEAAAHLAGKRVACPVCGAPIHVPAAAAARPIIACRCGQQFRADASLAGKTVACPACGNALSIPAAKSRPRPVGQRPAEPRYNVPPAARAPATLQPGSFASRPPATPERPFPLGLTVGIGSGAVVLLLLAIIGTKVWDSVRKWQPASSAAEQAAVQVDLPTAPEALEQYYQLPPDVKDATGPVLAACEVFSGPAFQTDRVGIAVVDRNARSVPPPGERWPMEAAARRLLDKYRDPLAQIHAALDGGGAVRFPMKFSDGPVAELAEVQAAVEALRMLELEARVLARESHAAGAARSLQTICRLGRSLGAHPSLVAQLVQVAAIRSVKSVLAESLGSVPFSDADLTMLSSEIAAADLDGGFHNGLLGDRVVGLVAFAEPAKAAQVYVAAMVQSGGDPQAAQAGAKTLARRPGFMVKQDKEAFERCMGIALRATKEPFPQRLATIDQCQQEVARLMDAGRIEKMSYILTLLLVPALEATLTVNASGTACRDLSLVAIAVERYRRDQGHLPEDLRRLVPDYLRAVPIDPFDGQSLRYIPGSDRYTLYSIGRNRRDDGAVETDETDIVFQVLIRSR